LTTLQAVKEPYLDFLVELSWPSGKLIKGFTVLLEHPGT
jgi:pilus assembly protein FimV